MKQSRPSSDHRLKVLRTRWWHSDYASIRPLWDELQAALTRARGRLLDLGCGNAPYRPWYESHVNEVVCADHPPVSESTNVGCAADALPFVDSTFDTVLCTQVLEHVARPWVVASEIHRVLRPGGILILSCPQYWPDHETPYDFFRFTEFGLKSLFPSDHWRWIHHSRQGRSFAVIGCSLWLTLDATARWKRAIIFLVNPFLLLLDRLFGNAADTTNHLIVVEKQDPNPPSKDDSAGSHKRADMPS